MANPLDIQHGGDHYKKLKIQPIEFAHKNNLDPCEFSVVKYITRHRSKNGIEDLKKAMHFLQMEMMFVYGVEATVLYEEQNTKEPPREEPLATPIMSFNKNEPKSMMVVSSFPNVILPALTDLNKVPEETGHWKYLWEVFPVFEKGTEGKIIGYRVGTKIDEKTTFMVRHYLTDEMEDSPSIGWCQNAAERQAEEFNKKEAIPGDFGGFVGRTSEDEKTSAEGAD